MHGVEQGCGRGRVGRPGGPASVSTKCCEARALFRDLQIGSVEAGGVLTFLGNSWGSEEPAGHVHPVPSALGPRPPPAATCGPGDGAGLSSDRWFGWVFFLPREPGGALCACMPLARTWAHPSSSAPCPPGLVPSPRRGHLVMKAPKSLVSAFGFVVRPGRLSPRGRSCDATGFPVLGCPVSGGTLAASVGSTHLRDHRNALGMAWCPSRDRVT